MAAVLVATLPTAAWFAAQAHQAASFLVLPDELTYVELAQSLAAHPLTGLEIYGETSTFTNGVYPALLAPFYALFGTESAFAAAHVLNGVLFASAAIPVVLLLRHLGAAPWHGALAGLLATWIPWASITTVMMTEAAAYPAFAWAVLAMTVAVSEPRPRNDALAVLAVVVCAGVRPQFILLFAVFVMAILVQAATAERGDATLRQVLAARLRPHVPLAIATALTVLVVFVVHPGILGPYAGLANEPRLPGGLLTVAAQYVARLSQGLAVVPIVLGLAFFVHALARPATPRQYAFALVGALSAGLVVYQAASFSRNVAGPWLHERYAVYAVIPLAVAAVALLADARRPAPLGTVLASGFALVFVASAVTYEPDLPVRGWTVLSPAQAFNDVWFPRLEQLNGIVPGGPHPSTEVVGLVIVMVTVGLAVVLSLRRRALVAAAVLLAVLGCNAYATDWSLDRAVRAVNADAAVNSPPDRAWIDAAADGRRVAALPGPLASGDPRDVWVSAQYWNTSVERLYAPPTGGIGFSLPTRVLDIDRDTGALRAPIDAPLAVLALGSPSFGLAGRVVERHGPGLALVELARPQRATYVMLGTDGDGETRPRTGAELHVYAPPAGAEVAVTLEAPPARRPTRWEVRAHGTVRRGRLGPSRRVTARLPVVTAPGSSRAVVRIRTPDVFDSPDGDRFGLRIVSVTVG